MCPKKKIKIPDVFQTKTKLALHRAQDQSGLIARMN